MKILITGSTGLLGQALVAQWAPRAEAIGLSRHAPPGGSAARHVACDLTDPRAVREAVAALGPAIVCNAQAVSDVDRCEEAPELARRGNVQTVEALTAALQGTGAVLVHLSTDYVFDGRAARPYREGDAPQPLSAYGRSKVAGEQAALAYGRGVVVRTSTLFGPGRRTFCEQVREAAAAGRPIEAFADQVTSPTYTADLAAALVDLSLRRHAADTWPEAALYHAVNAGAASRVAFARRVVELLGGDAGLVRPIRMAEQAHAARRPAFSALECTKLTAVIGRRLRSWDEALQAYLTAAR